MTGKVMSRDGVRLAEWRGINTRCACKDARAQAVLRTERGRG